MADPISVLFDKFNRGKALRNPPALAGEDDISSFLRAMAASGEIGSFSEGDWIAFGKREEMSDMEIVELIEQAAGWVPDTSGERHAPEKAAWTRL